MLWGRSNRATGNFSNAVGYSNTASGAESSALGLTNTASGTNSSAVGYRNTASGTNSNAVGYRNTAGNLFANSIGSGVEKNAIGRDGIGLITSIDGIAVTTTVSNLQDLTADKITSINGNSLVTQNEKMRLFRQFGRAKTQRMVLLECHWAGQYRIRQFK